ncbi:MAG: phage terminase large subunit family protein [Thermoplasmata archaeon]|nr:phage terminase large subunit family protein [Thermoplasmata archaeon]
MYTPYLIEPIDNMSPNSPVQHTGILKNAQGGWTMGAECIIIFYVDYEPRPQLFVSATQDLLEKWAVERLDKAIDGYNIRHKIGATLNTKGSRRTGDKTFQKEYMGLFLDMVSAQSAPSLRAVDKCILIRDEISGVPLLLKTGEGSWLDVSEARLNAWGDMSKIFDLSTPGILGECPMYDIYMQGDQRKFLIPCPLCGKTQELKWGPGNEQYGLKWEMSKGFLVKNSTVYMCEHCHDPIPESTKGHFLIKGRWEPSAKSYPDMRTYSINTMYSPTRMFSWEKIVRKYLKAQTQPADIGMRAFTNLYLGQPYKEQGTRPKLENVIDLQGGYREKEVPDGVLYLTIGVDKQTGSKTDPDNPPRLELEVLGMGSKYRTWSIDYEVFAGDLSNPFAGAWEDFYQWLISEEAIFRRSDGREFPVQLTFIDSGDGTDYDIVYKFSERLNACFPCKGFHALTRRKKEKGDVIGPNDMKRYRASKMDKHGSVLYYQISTHYYKGMIYSGLKVRREGLGEQPACFSDFPMGRSENYFRMLTAEELRADGSYHAAGRRNEALDCRVYAHCAADVYLDALVLQFKAKAQADGADPIKLQSINHKFVLDYMERTTKRNYGE